MLVWAGRSQDAVNAACAGEGATLTARLALGALLAENGLKYRPDEARKVAQALTAQGDSVLADQFRKALRIDSVRAAPIQPQQAPAPYHAAPPAGAVAVPPEEPIRPAQPHGFFQPPAAPASAPAAAPAPARATHKRAAAHHASQIPAIPQSPDAPNSPIFGGPVAQSPASSEPIYAVDMGSALRP